MRRGCALLLVLALAGCGQGRANHVLSEAADSLGKIRSGDVTLRLVVSPREGRKGRVGFELHGPFALRPGALPVAKIAYTQIAGEREATATFISTGTKAYAEVNGKVSELPPSAVEEVRRASGGLGSNGLGSFDIKSWFNDPKVMDEGPLEHVSADLDVVAAANGLLDLVRGLGRPAPTIEGKSADQLRDAVESSSIDVWATTDEHVFRRALLKAQLGFDVPRELRRALGDVVGAKVEFELAIANPNEPVSVPPPAP